MKGAYGETDKVEGLELVTNQQAFVSVFHSGAGLRKDIPVALSNCGRKRLTVRSKARGGLHPHRDLMSILSWVGFARNGKLWTCK